MHNQTGAHNDPCMPKKLDFVKLMQLLDPQQLLWPAKIQSICKKHSISINLVDLRIYATNSQEMLR